VRSGTPLLVDGIAVVNGTERLDAARAYYEFVSSREAIDSAMHKFVRIPARNDIDEAALPDWIRVSKPLLKPMPLDRQLMADSLDAWMTYWDGYIRNRGRKR